uniref:mannose-1-phosphate guanylyltransferase/mannose-6-phosphate isomerase n=1 Tax=uncultured Sphingomonas sp. TaxID=158754 RepID=UPI0025D96506|nr:mannose-1-phosphate guanylyltransferase/mannose-6-phosphate isomerase [uncultured Sphingomonas sp.]
MSGGSGTRLWPLSRQSFPKQLLPIVGDRSMLQETAARVSGPGFAAPIVVAGEDHRFFIKRQLEDAGLAAEAILLEPGQRNTAAAAALAAEWSMANGQEGEVLLLMPSDHIIRDRHAFVDAVRRAAPHAGEAIITFGARPDEPSTQYGYIQVGEPVDGEARVRRIVRFVEKPERRTAEEYAASGEYLWNAGIFLFSAQSYLQELDRRLPDTRAAIAEAMKASSSDGTFIRPEPAAFLRAENISIDHGVMEHTELGLIVPVEMDWSDLGSWSAVWKASPKDGANNAVQGDVLTLDTRNSLVRSDGRATVTTIGLEDTAVVAMRDAILVAPLSRADEVKQIVQRMEKEGRDSATTPSKVARPWGSYESLDQGARFQIKHIVVQPGEQLSLQMHYHRSEHWIVVKGTAEVTVGDKVSLLQENQSTYIPAGTTHRLANPGKVPLEMVEVQCGPYLGEDDIVRFNDEYGRA